MEDSSDTGIWASPVGLSEACEVGLTCFIFLTWSIFSRSLMQIFVAFVLGPVMKTALAIVRK